MITQANPFQPLDFLKVVAHELRWQIITSLIHSDYCVQELIALLKQPQNLVSYHLKQLRESQLVVERRSTADAREVYYSLDLVRLEALYHSVGTALHPALNQTVDALEMPPDTLARSPAMNARVLFLCTENSARSQMAEGILRHLTRDRLAVFSAGTAPSFVHPNAIRALAEMGIDISQQRAKGVDEFDGQSFDYVVTVCDRARENCPVFPNETQLIHWSFPDPATVTGNAAQYQAFVETAQQLRTRTHYFLTLIQHQKEALT